MKYNEFFKYSITDRAIIYNGIKLIFGKKLTEENFIHITK